MLKYVGDGSAFTGIPARDLTEDEIKTLEGTMGWKNLKKTLVDSGLYTLEPTARPEKGKEE